MATMHGRDNRTYEAGSAVSQYRFVDLAADGQVDHSADGAKAVGVTLNSASAAGDALTVARSGQVLVYVGEALTAGDAVAATTDGKAATATTGEIIVGYAVEDAAVDTLGPVEIFLGGNASA